MTLNELLEQIDRIRKEAKPEDKVFLDAFWEINKAYWSELHHMHTRPDTAFYFGTFAERGLQNAVDICAKIEVKK